MIASEGPLNSRAKHLAHKIVFLCGDRPVPKPEPLEKHPPVVGGFPIKKGTERYLMASQIKYWVVAESASSSGSSLQTRKRHMKQEEGNVGAVIFDWPGSRLTAGLQGHQSGGGTGDSHSLMPNLSLLGVYLDRFQERGPFSEIDGDADCVNEDYPNPRKSHELQL